MYVLPKEKREELRKPLGEVIDEETLKKREIKGKIVTIGDKVTLTLKKNGIQPDMAIIDYKIERKECSKEEKQVLSNGKRIIKVKNPAGKITSELWNAVATGYALDECITVEVEGEEDLAALPAIYLAPRNTTVLYGLPSKGIVVVEVGKNEREKVWKFLKQMEE
ncbi:MAG: DUF359 domain-containing protein [Thermoplasmata archaeon]|nr:MAG: DUF359 domain-containing protein [Thermoplasmata archaeon]